MCLAAGLVLIAGPTRAQDHADHADAAPPEQAGAWQWRGDAAVFFGFNHQDRRFRDFSVWESQNWLMGTGVRPLGRGRLRLVGMLSLEPWTLDDIGSPQAFQTGETFRGGALIDYQHPHDLVMALGGDVDLPVGATTVRLGLDLVGSPSLGPPAFMHRPSAEANPQVPLAHHHLDASHISSGVVRAAVAVRGWAVEGSWFRGQEPDENRTDLDPGALDSHAVRVTWSRGPWSAQASGGWLTAPERVTPYDATRLTASLAYGRRTEARGVAWMLAFGQNREIHGNLEAYLFEATWHPGSRHTLYTRVESVAKDILDVGFHPVNTFHRHRQSQVGAATLGYLRTIVRSSAGGSVGAGADITGYVVPSNLREAYGAPVSFHAFLRYRFRDGAEPHAH